jgi:hypothetical protein
MYSAFVDVTTDVQQYGPGPTLLQTLLWLKAMAEVLVIMVAGVW